jgi:CRP-like cAMP-binding protein
MRMRSDKLSFLGPQDIALLLRHAQRRKVGRGEVIVREGQSPEAIFVVQEGFISVRAGGVTVGYFGPGQVLGEISFLERRSASATVLAEGDAVVDRIDNADLEALLSAHPDLAARFYRSLAANLSRRVRELSQDISRLRGQRSGPARAQRARYGQLSARHVPRGLLDGLSAVHREIARIEEALEARRMAEDAAARATAAACDRLVALLEENTSDKALLAISVDDLLTFRDVNRVREGVGAFVFRNCFSRIMSSATMARCYTKPAGFPEDDQTLRAMVEGDAEGDGFIGPLVDRWFLGRPICRVRREARRAMTEEVVRRARARDGRGPLHVTSLGGAAGDELLDALDEVGAEAIVATCIDGDPDALRRGNHQADDAGLAASTTFLCADTSSLAGTEIDLLPQHLVYVLGAFDYMDDAEAVTLLDWIHAHLAPGGVATFANLTPALPDLLLMEHLLEWSVVARDEARLRALVRRSRFGEAVEIRRGLEGWMHVVTCTRGA